jgi:hypothetical protein
LENIFFCRKALPKMTVSNCLTEKGIPLFWTVILMICGNVELQEERRELLEKRGVVELDQNNICLIQSFKIFLFVCKITMHTKCVIV